MLVSEFYYGKCEGDQSAAREQKSNTTFKCNSCLKILKNNIRYGLSVRRGGGGGGGGICDEQQHWDTKNVSLSGVSLEKVYGRKLHHENRKHKNKLNRTLGGKIIEK